MPCKYCGKNKELYGIADFVGDVCKDCYFISGVRKEARVIRIIKRELKNLVGEILYD